jgi:K(+)-stimulated pyrophosphate-energized sodium pump
MTAVDLFLPGTALAGVFGLVAAFLMSRAVLSRDEGSEEVRRIGRLIKTGALAFLRREYLTLGVFVIAVAVLIALVIDLNVLGNPRIAELNQELDQRIGAGPWTALSYLLGALGSGFAGFVGMSIAIRANTRTATAAIEGLNPALRVAFRSGAVMGLSVVGTGLLGITALWVIFQDPNAVAGFAFGASSVALFARVGGGIYTKAADVGADLVGKVEAGIPEDDPRNPATIADNVGDNVGDVAGMGADLFESYAGALVASLSLAAAGAVFFQLGAPEFDAPLMLLPLAIAGAGILAAVIGTFFVRTSDNASMGGLLRALRQGIYAAAVMALIAAALILVVLDLPMQLFVVVLAGLLVGEVIGTSTTYFTSYQYRPTRWIAEQAVTGPASVTIAGVAVGFVSVFVPAVAIVIGILVAFELAGLYGVALAAVGMLSTLGITLATDAYGPVADNAGGIAEQAHLPHEVRERTDALDALGNTTAATGKGFAIGSAVLTALALMAAYMQVAGVGPMELTNPRLMAGLILGGMLPFLFSALTLRAVGNAAGHMIEEVRRQFREIPGLLEGRPGVEPDAARAIDISTQGALKSMFLPAGIAVAAPVVVGVLLGAEALGGLLMGSIVTGFLLASFMANSGGAWDNAKKWIELGNVGGKGSDAHSAAVTGDTIGDPFKDTSGPSINILLKLMAVVAIIFGPLFV